MLKALSACLQIVGQTADLVDLQRILQRSKKKLNNSQQQNITVGPCSALQGLRCSVFRFVLPHPEICHLAADERLRC